jgi:hypothetical protein
MRNAQFHAGYNLNTLNIFTFEQKINQSLDTLELKLRKIDELIQEYKNEKEIENYLFDLKNKIIQLKESIFSVYIFIVQAKSNMDLFNFKLEVSIFQILKEFERTVNKLDNSI